MTAYDWKDNARKEIARAEAARGKGNEGMARVCARRAAGHIIREFLKRRDFAAGTTNAFSLIQIVQSSPELSPEIKEVASHFLLRITPEHALPVEADLIEEARWLARELLGEEVNPS